MIRYFVFTKNFDKGGRMKTIIRIIVLVSGTILLFQPLGFAANAPEGVDEIFEAMEKLEESYENYLWQEALEATDTIQKELQGIFVQAQLDDATLEKKITELRESVEKKSKDETEVNFIRFQKQFFIFISNFDYEVHPVLKIIEEYIFEEAAEAAEKKEFEEVASEMVEVGNLIDTASPFLLKKGISEDAISNFKSEVYYLIKVARKEDPHMVNSSLEKVMEM